MELIYEYKPPFRIAGISTLLTANTDFPALWDELFRQQEVADLQALGNGESFGACYRRTPEQELRYMAAYDLLEEEAAQAMNLEILEIPAAYYAVLTVHGPVPQSIQEGWKALEEELAKENYQHAGTPDLEVYSLGDMTSADYMMQLWVPVVAKEEEE